MQFLNQDFSLETLKALSVNELPFLAEEIRKKIIDVLSINGGHLSSNLGIVELTIAMHYAFNSPRDKFIFDVSHQIYTHKIVTGRSVNFFKLRKIKGICGFSHPKESQHDHFYLGHAGTAISMGLGLAKGRDLLKQNDYVLPIIGDGSLTCGLTLEALNNIPKELTKFIIVLNDNDMAICKNVGNIKNILSRFINNPISNKLYQDFQSLIAKIPSIGKTVANQMQTFSESVKNLVSPASFFEHLGLSYIGPIDGHNIKKMIDTFEAAKKVDKPTIIHLLTTKGKGMPQAIENPISYHGVRPFDVNTGKFLPVYSSSTFPQVFGSHLLNLAEENENIVVINPAMLAGSCLLEFAKKFPQRCIDVGIAEGHALTLAGGLAYFKNLKVFVSIYSTFLQRAFDNLFHDICLQEAPVIFAIDRASLSGPDGATHHGIYDISFLNAMPNLIIAQPRDGNILKEIMQSALNWQRPVAIRYPNLPTETSSQSVNLRDIGKAEILSHGKHLLIVALGHTYQTAQEVQNILQKDGIYPTIVDPVFIKPLDKDLFYDLLLSHNNVVTIEEHVLSNGFGQILNNFIIQNGFSNIEVLNFGIPDLFVEHGENDDLKKSLEIDAKSIAKKIVSRFELKRMISVEAHK